MQIDGNTIRTPLLELGDDPLNAEPDWAHRMALCVANASTAPRLPAVVTQHPVYDYIRQYVAYIKSPPGAQTDMKYNLIAVATKWHSRADGTLARDYLEPLLLSSALYPDISALLIPGPVGPALIDTYEKLYYNCRDAKGLDCLSPIRRRIMAHGAEMESRDPNNIAKIVGASTLSYAALADMWGTWNISGLAVPQGKDNDDYINRIIRYRLALRAHSLDDEFLVQMRGVELGREKQKFDMQVGHIEAEGPNVTLALLQALCGKPSMVNVMALPAGEELKASLDNKRKADQNIGKTKVPDHGYKFWSTKDGAEKTQVKAKAKGRDTKKGPAK